MVVNVNRVGPEGIWGEVIQERRQYIADTARCADCGSTRSRAPRAEPDVPDFCPERSYPNVCRYIDSRDMTDAFIREIMAGEVRTVAEAYPPPVQGPNLPSYDWLLWQDTWWYPHRRPAIRIAEMEKTHRFNTVRFLERKAAALHLAIGLRCMGNAPDEVWNAFDAEEPMKWLREQPLMRALSKGLPHPDCAKGRALAARAIHWNTCPMRLKFPGRLDRCLCVRDGSGRIVGATNDPKTAVTV